MKTFLHSIKIIAIATVLAVGVSYVSAFTSNGAPSPAGNPTNNVPSIINVGGPEFQTKVGSFTSESFLKAGTNSTPGLPGWIIAANGTNAPDNGGVTSLWQFFQKEYLINKPGTFAQMKVGSRIVGRPNNPLPSVDKTKFNPKDTAIPLTIDLIDRGSANNSATGTQVMDLLAGDVCNNATTVQTNTAGIQFWSTSNNSNADVIARGIQIGDSSAGAMKVLVATDTAGNAVWGTMRIANGQVVVDYPGSSDVAAGQACDVAPAVTYSWSTGTWGACTSSYPADWTDFIPEGAPYTTWGTLNQSCSSWIAARNDRYETGSQVRDVVCKDSNGNTVSDSLCTGTKPDTAQACVTPLQYRVKASNITTDQFGNATTTNQYSNSGYCQYAKLTNPNSTDPLANILATDCQTRKITDPVPSGYNPVSFCGTIYGTSSPGYPDNSCAGFGFNVGPGGGSGGSNNCQIGIGSLNMNLQVKKQ